MSAFRAVVTFDVMVTFRLMVTFRVVVTFRSHGGSPPPQATVPDGGTLLIRNSASLGHYSRIMPRVL